MPKQKNNLTYQNAITELQEIIEQIENEQISIDQLTDKTKRATELITLCRNKLRQTENDIEQNTP